MKPIMQIFLYSFLQMILLVPVYVFGSLNSNPDDAMKKIYVKPHRIVWQSSGSSIANTQVLLREEINQAYFGNKNVCRMQNIEGQQSGILLDFGKELHGGIRITTALANNKLPRVRIRFGESVSEANGESFNIHRGEDGSTNHHALRDFEQVLPGFGTLEIGNTGFRFVRIDLLGEDTKLNIQDISAIATYRDIPYLGSFRSNDTLLNQIWETGAYTVHLNMGEYLMDGIKRDRMVWSGDIHPQLMVINHVFGFQDIIPKTLDLLRDTSPLPKFINGISSYSLWWVIMQYDWYRYHGKQAYLLEQREYLLNLLDLLATYVDGLGREQLPTNGMRFIDWPSYGDEVAVHAGLQAMMVMAFDRGAHLCGLLDEKEKAVKYNGLANKMRQYVLNVNDSKQVAALQVLAGMVDAAEANKNIIDRDGAKRFSAFFGYYMLQAQAQAGDYTAALKNIRDFWGRMLDMGATTFWEEFDIEEAEGAGRIDEIVPDGVKDYHLSTGIECYIGLRRSLCHGWSAGPTAWLSEHVLGIQILEPGGKKIKISPHLGDLQWAEGTYPTEFGLVHIRHARQKDGKVKTKVKAPKGVEIIQ